MKVAIVKQVLDTLGPWSTLRWEETTPKGLFNLWPGKGLHWEMTTLFQADWFVVPQQTNTDYIYDSILKHPGKAAILKRYTHRVVKPSEIPLDAYDLVIALDPVLHFPCNSQTLFAYFLAEHWDWRYRKSLQQPMNNADLFLAHMMDAPQRLERLPQAVPFPYVRDPETMRRVFHNPQKDDALWIDWRMLLTLSMSQGYGDPAAFHHTANRISSLLNIPSKYRAFHKALYVADDPPLWGDAHSYLQEISSCKYYAALGRQSGAGQGLADAASAGCICFGEIDKAYHRLLCHPECLSEDLQEFPRKFRRVYSSADLRREVLAVQEENLRTHFIDGPRLLLEEAIDKKRRSAHLRRQPQPPENIALSRRKAKGQAA